MRGVPFKYQKGYKIKDIARIVGKSENAVKLILSRVRKKLTAHPHLKSIAGFTDTKRKKSKARYKDLYDLSTFLKSLT